MCVEIVYRFVECDFAAKTVLNISWFTIVFENSFQILVKSQSYVQISQVYNVQCCVHYYSIV